MLHSRKSIMGVTAALVLTLLFAACILVTREEAPPPALPAEPQAGTRLVHTVMGVVKVPEKPKRVAVNFLQGNVLALGVVPVAVSVTDSAAWFKEEVQGIPVIENWTSPEEVLSYEPDLIITVSQAEYEKLKKVAPVVYIPFTKMSIEETMVVMGQALGKTEEAKARIDEYHTVIQACKNRLREAGIQDKTITIIEGDNSMLRVFGDKFGRGGEVIYHNLGLRAPENIQRELIASTNKHFHEISLEGLPQYSGDFIFRSTWAGVKLLDGNPVWDGISAVKAGHVIDMPFGMTFYTDIKSSMIQAEFFTEELIKKAQIH